MGRVIAVEEQSGKTVVVRYECDGVGCDAVLTDWRDPGSEGGQWIQVGNYYGVGDPRNKDRVYYCPRCAERRQ